MNNSVKRVLLFLSAVVVGVGLSLLFILAGDKSIGPLSDLMNVAGVRISSFEKRFISFEEERSAQLKWLDSYRYSAAQLTGIDRVLLGAYDDNTAESFETVVALEDSLETKLPIISIYTAWGSRSNQVFPMLRAQAIHDLGSIPMITWEPWLDDFDPGQYPANAENRNKGGMKAVAEGKYDAYIDKWALDARKLGVAFFLRLGHEMNDPYRYPWGPQNNKPDEYIAAWRHVVERFRAQGATNAIWVWSPHPAYLTYEDFYPGADYVDWVGTTGINYGTVATWSQWWSFDAIVGKFYRKVAEYNKPVMICEFGSLSVGGDRPAWYSEALTDLPRRYPLVKALVFYHNGNDQTTTYKQLDWTFRTDLPVVRVVKKSTTGWLSSGQKAGVGL
jgi:hypothetical protein